MKIKLDENLPASLASALLERGHDVHTVNDEQLGGASDVDLLRIAQSEGRLFITQDVRLADERGFRGLEHPGVVVIRTKSDTRAAIVAAALSAFARYDPESWRNCTVTITETRARPRRTDL